MTRIVVNETLLSQLHNLTEPLELYDQRGRLLGRVFPAPEQGDYEQVEPPISEEELQRREQSGEKRYTTAEVLAYLEKL
jgi:hypothetical protein